jgi:hypothetical protein
MSEAVGIDPQARPRGEIIAERNTVVPPWAPAIRDYSVTVKVREGSEVREIPPGFTIGDVAPECRWAIDPATGIVMDQATFKQEFDRWYMAHYTMQNPPVQVEGEALSVPGVVDFVSRMVHPDDITKVIPIGTDLRRPMVSKPRLMYDRDGENPMDPEVAKAQARVGESGAKMQELVQMLEDGDITQEVFIKRSKKLYGGSVVVGGENADSAEPTAAGSPPPSGFEPVPEKKPDDLPPATNFAPEAPPPVKMVAALCGKEFNPKGVHVHEHRCKECKAIKEQQEE